jgi:hypothetical protein
MNVRKFIHTHLQPNVQRVDGILEEDRLPPEKAGLLGYKWNVMADEM